MTRNGPRIRRREQRAKQIVQGEAHVVAGRRAYGFLVLNGIENELPDNACRARSTAPV
jgi:hypothetical protein